VSTNGAVRKHQWCSVLTRLVYQSFSCIIKVEITLM